jgi:excisionase family DNA binding protein
MTFDAALAFYRRHGALRPEPLPRFLARWTDGVERVIHRGRLLNAIEAAAYLGISETHVRHLIRDRQIAVMRNDNGRLIGIYSADLDAFQARCLVPATTSDVSERRARTAGVDAAMKDLIGDGPRAFAH